MRFQLKFRYDKRSGTGAIAGQLYEVKMCCLMYLRGIRYGHFHLAANLNVAGAFDDVVLQLHSTGDDPSRTYLIQLKHKKNAGLSRTKLLACSPKCKLGLIKYFISYRDEILPEFQNRRSHQVFGSSIEDITLVLYTNANVTGMPEVSDFERDILSTGFQGGVYCFREDRDKDVWGLAQNVEGFGDISEYVMFLQRLKVYTRQATEAELNSIIKDELCDALHINVDHSEVVFSKLLDQIQEWWGADEGTYLTEQSPLWDEVVGKVLETINDPTHRQIGKLEIRFNDDALELLAARFSDARVVLCRADGESTRLSLCKVVQALEWGRRRFVLGHSDAALRFWQSPWCPLLALECPDPTPELLRTLAGALDLHPDKTLILVVREKDLQAVRDLVPSQCVEFNDKNNLTNLDGASQHRVLSMKVDFQGYDVPLGELIRINHTPGDNSDTDYLLEQMRTISNSIKTLGDKLVFSIDFNIESFQQLLSYVESRRHLLEHEKDKQIAMDTNVLLDVRKNETDLCVELHKALRCIQNIDTASEDKILLDKLQKVTEYLDLLNDSYINAKAIIKTLNGVVRRRDLFQCDGFYNPVINADFFLKLQTDELKLIATLQDVSIWEPNLERSLDDRSLLESLRAVGMILCSPQDELKRNFNVEPVIELLDRVTLRWNVTQLSKDPAEASKSEYLRTLQNDAEELGVTLEQLILNMTEAISGDILFNKLLKYVHKFLHAIRFHSDLKINVDIDSVLRLIADVVKCRKVWREEYCSEKEVSDQNTFNLQIIEIHLSAELEKILYYQQELGEALEVLIMYLKKDIVCLAMTYHQKRFKRSLVLLNKDAESLKLIIRHRDLNESIENLPSLLKDDAKHLCDVYEHEYLKEYFIILLKQLEDDTMWLDRIICEQKVKQTLTSNALYSLLKDKSMHLGARLIDQISYYIPRTLQREGSMRPESAWDLPERVTVIVAEPGMGKSILMTHIALQTKFEKPTTWVIRVNLNSMTSFLQDIQFKHLAQDHVIQFMLACFKGATLFEMTLLEHSLTTAGRIVVILDGFDEVCPHYKDQMIGVIQGLLETKVQKLLITSRQYLRHELEACSHTLAYSINPFSENDQRSFLRRMWGRHVTAMDETRLERYIADVLCLVSESLSDTDRSFMGIPLQTMLVAEVFKSDLKDDLHAVKSSPRRLEVTELYEQFFRKKCAIYFEQKEGVDMSKPGVINYYENKIKEIEECHEIAAVMSYISPEDRCKLNDQSIQDKANKFLEEYERKWAMVGIVTSTVEGNPHFLHRTVAEFLVGKWFSKHFQTNRDFIRNTLYTTDYSVVKLIFDKVLACGFALHSAVLNGNAVALGQILNRSNVNATDKGGRTALHIVATSKYSEDLGVMTRMLIKSGADVTVKDEVLRLSPVEHANLTRNWGAVDIMLSETTVVPKLVIPKEIKTGVLETACRNGYLELLRYLVRGGVDMNTKTDETHSRPLHVAIQHNQVQAAEYLLRASRRDMGAVKHLLRQGVQVNAKDNTGYTALHYAALKGHLAAVRLLIEAGCNVNVCSKRIDTALSIAAKETHFDIVELLVEAGGKVNVHDKDNMTPLHYASRSMHFNAVRVLIEAGCNVDACNDYNMTPLHYCAMSGYVDIVRYLINAGCKVDMYNKGQTTALHLAVVKGCTDVVKVLVEAGSEVNATGKSQKTPLHFAAENGHVEVARFLLEAGCEVDARDEELKTPLHYAAEKNSINIVKLLIEVGCTVNAYDQNLRTPGYYAHEGGHEYTTQLLVEAGLDNDITAENYVVDLKYATNSEMEEKGTATDKKEYIPLHNAAKEGQLTAVEQLVGLGYNVNECDMNKRTPLHYASRMGHVDTVRLLIELGCEVDACDQYKETPLHYSAEEGHLEIVELLVHSGCDLHACNKYGMTPLHYAAMYGHLDTFRCLVECGSDVLARDIADLTPLERAVGRGHKRIVRYLASSATSLGRGDD